MRPRNSIDGAVKREVYQEVMSANVVIEMRNSLQSL